VARALRHAVVSRLARTLGSGARPSCQVPNFIEPGAQTATGPGGLLACNVAAFGKTCRAERGLQSVQQGCAALEGKARPHSMQAQPEVSSTSRRPRKDISVTNAVQAPELEPSGQLNQFLSGCGRGRCLTLRSTRAPTATHVRPGWAKMLIVPAGPYALRCRARVSSNVRHRKANVASYND
jgi:hypothetical protein